MSELSEFEGTSMAAPLLSARPDTTIRFGGILDEEGTSSGLVVVFYSRRPLVSVPLASPAGQVPSDAADALEELRRRTGFSWEQVARVLDVSPRTPFLWSRGSPINRANEERLQRLLAVIRRADRGNPDATRIALIGANSEGLVPFDLLAKGDFEAAERVLSVRPLGGPVSEETLRQRFLMSPIDRISLSDEPLHVERGTARKARAVRRKKGE